MTRDEAIEKFGSVGGSSFASSAWIDRFVAIGILKLDEPKGPNERAVDAMFAVGSVLAPRHAIEAIHKAGLKIVEK